MTTRLSPSAAGSYLAEDGAGLVDLREAPDFAAGHPEGAICIPYSDRGFATRLRLVDPEVRRVVLVTSPAGRPPGAAAQLGELGIDLIGHGPAEPGWWADAGIAWRALNEVPLEALDGSDELVVVDVREPIEWATGHVPGALLISLGEIPSRRDELPSDRELVLICETGIRSATAASILLRAGYEHVSHAPLGTAGIRRAGGPLEIPETAAAEVP